jgi:hypothetical protein
MNAAIAKPTMAPTVRLNPKNSATSKCRNTKKIGMQ